MSFTRRIFVSSPVDEVLDPSSLAIKNSILKKIEDAGYEPQLFLLRGLPQNMAWSFKAASEVIRRCSGALVLGLPRFRLSGEHEMLLFASEYTHYEGAVAHTLGLPVLTIAQRGIRNSGVYWEGGGNPILYIPPAADTAWVEAPQFTQRFSAWLKEVGERRDVFLGYCSKARLAAQAVHLYLTKDLQVTVLDWAMDFIAGGSILDEVERAASICSVGILLFTKDDPLEGNTGHAAPRDNVVFEAGYFVHAKGKERVLIIREDGAKMPADIGGAIYASLPSVQDTAAIESVVRRFLAERM